jgi:hypothetical protein
MVKFLTVYLEVRKTEKRDIEAEIVAKYVEGWSLEKIQTEYELTPFELAYILGKNKVPARQRGHVGNDTATLSPGLQLRVPTKIVKELGLVENQKIKFLVVSKDKLSLQLQIVPETEA